MPSNNYQVIARRWRPKNFEELVGQDHIKQTLKHAIQQNRIAHAYLFIGPRGTGKTSTARLFAQALNCEEGPSVTPNPDSPICKAIAEGRSMDVIEIDGASNNSVDQIRDLREDCQYTPAQCKFKIYIIDEVHMLSSAAFNALLKTLEEPPAHVKFIFATTEAQKVLPTITSRCQRFEFRPIPDNIIAEKLEQICKAEEVTVTETALLAIARIAQGGMRDAQSILDQLIAFCGSIIEEEDVLNVYGLISHSTIQELGEALQKNDISKTLQISKELSSQGSDLFRTLIDLQSYFHTLLVQSANNQDTSSDNLIQILNALQEASATLHTSFSQEAHFEITLLKCIEICKTQSIDELIKTISNISPPTKPEEASENPSAPSNTTSPEEKTPAHKSPSGSSDLASHIPPSSQEVLKNRLHGQVKGIRTIDSSQLQ